MPILFALLVAANFSSGAGLYEMQPIRVGIYQSHEQCVEQANRLKSIVRGWLAICIPVNG